MINRIAVVICNFNGRAYLARCVDSILRSDMDRFDVFVVDNASTDGSAAFLKERYPQVVLLQNEENLGGAGGFQTGFQYAMEQGYGYIMAMDNDAFVAEDTMRLLYEYMEEHMDTGMAAAKIMCLEEPDKILDYAGTLDFPSLAVKLDWWLKPDCEEAERVADADFAPTTASLIRREALAASGGMDPEYFIYLDDIEMSQRMKRSGFRVVSVGYAKAWHKKGQSREMAPTTFAQYYFNRNRFFFFSRFAEENEVERLAEQILRDSWQTMADAHRNGYPAVFAAQRYALEDFIEGIRGKAATGRIRKIRCQPDDSLTPQSDCVLGYGFFRQLYYDRLLERIGILRGEMKNREAPKVSVIIPVCNDMNALPACVESVLRQSLRELQVVCVDYGSTDGTGKLLDEYADADRRVTVLHTENEGWDKALSVGVECALAPCIAIVKSGDCVERDTYLTLYETMLQTYADVVMPDCDIIREYGGKICKRRVTLDAENDSGKIYRKALTFGELPASVLFLRYTWFGLYRRKLPDECRQLWRESPKGVDADRALWLWTLVRAERIVFLDEALYHHKSKSAVSLPPEVWNNPEELELYRAAEDCLVRIEKENTACRSRLGMLRLADGYCRFHCVEREGKHQAAQYLRLELLRLSEEGNLDAELFSSELKEKLFDLLVAPETVIERDCTKTEGFRSKLAPYSSYLIYGAGRWALRLLRGMRKEALENRIVCFAVTEGGNNPSELEGFPVFEFENNLAEAETLAIIAVKDSQGIEERLRAAGFAHIIHFRDLQVE